MSQSEKLMELLKELKERHPEAKACMMARRGLEGLIMFPESFKEEVSTLWDPISKNLDDMLTVVAEYSGIGLNRLYSEILGFGVFFLPLTGSDTALIVFVTGADPLKESANLLDDMAATRDKALLMCSE